MGRREDNRRLRRARVLAAARALVEEDGIEGLSMRKLAGRSGLAVNTIYGLFGGSREAVLEALIENGIESMHEALDEQSFDDPLHFARSIITRGIEHFLASEALYRAAFLAELQSPRVRPWGMGVVLRRGGEALQNLVGAGFVRDDVDLRLLAHEMMSRFRTLAHHWARGTIDGSELRARGLYSLHICLLAIATDQGRPRLLEGLRQAERELQALTSDR